MTANAILFVASFAMVFLKAIQQQNVVGGHYYLAAITSFMLAVAEVSLVISVVGIGFEAFVYVGLGGAVGVIAAMYMHSRIINVVKFFNRFKNK
jgi:uncharacterized membrane-anchored protein